MTRRLNVVNNHLFPAYVVWELTLRCDQRCTHCGSRAALPRRGELNLAQALKVVGDLAALGCKEVILIGGEAYLHEDFLSIALALTKADISVGVTSGGRGISLERAHAMKSVGINRVSISIDGLRATHNMLRGAKGSYQDTMLAIENLHAANIRPSVNTTINSLNKGQLEELYEIFKALKVTAWQLQIVAPLGRAADRPGMLLEPFDLLDILPRIAAIKKRAFAEGMLLMSGNNLGYFGPDEAILRSLDEGGQDHFQGCQAGRYILGIESDGTIKGCPSLQTAFYAEGSVANESLQDLWPKISRLSPSSSIKQKELWGFCKTCPFADTCQAGCTFTAHALFGKAGNNPFCYFRAQEFAKKGLRERLVLVEPAKGQPFDHAIFKIVEESLDAPSIPSTGNLLKKQR